VNNTAPPAAGHTRSRERVCSAAVFLKKFAQAARSSLKDGWTRCPRKARARPLWIGKRLLLYPDKKNRETATKTPSQAATPCMLGRLRPSPRTAGESATNPPCPTRPAGPPRHTHLAHASLPANVRQDEGRKGRW